MTITDNSQNYRSNNIKSDSKFWKCIDFIVKRFLVSSPEWQWSQPPAFILKHENEIKDIILKYVVKLQAWQSCCLNGVWWFGSLSISLTSDSRLVHASNGNKGNSKLLSITDKQLSSVLLDFHTLSLYLSLFPLDASSLWVFANGQMKLCSYNRAGWSQNVVTH